MSLGWPRDSPVAHGFDRPLSDWDSAIGWMAIVNCWRFALVSDPLPAPSTSSMSHRCDETATRVDLGQLELERQILALELGQVARIAHDSVR